MQNSPLLAMVGSNVDSGADTIRTSFARTAQESTVISQNAESAKYQQTMYARSLAFSVVYLQPAGNSPNLKTGENAPLSHHDAGALL